jgi:hypothetical protein
MYLVKKSISRIIQHKYNRLLFDPAKKVVQEIFRTIPHLDFGHLFRHSPCSKLNHALLPGPSIGFHVCYYCDL